MARKIDELGHIASDPVSQHTLVIDMIEQDGGIELKDPTNPYVKMMEAMSVTSAAVVGEVIKADKRIFPSLASTEEDLYPHVIGDDEVNLFATPAYSSLTFFISMDSIKLNAKIDDNKYKAVIPANTFVTINDIELTITNDIEINVTESSPNIYRSFVENKISEFTEQASDIGSIESSVTVDDNGEPWLTFQAPVKQLTVIWLEALATKGLSFDIRVPLDKNQYYSSEVKLRDGTVLNKVFSDEYYDAETPSVFVKVMDNEVIYSIPRAFIDNGTVNGVVDLFIYTTLGKMHKPLSIYSPEDYQIKVFSSNKTGAHTAARNLDYYIFSNKAITGGVTKRKFKDMRTKIINRATGRLEVPITEFHLKERFRFIGLAVYKALDTILDRLYIVSKDSFQKNELDLKSLMYTFCNSFNLVASELNNHSKILIDSRTTIIKPGTVFTNDDKSITAVSDTLLSTIDAMPISEKLVYLNKNQMLFTPFLYIIDNRELDTSSRVYEIDTPSIEYRRITDKNSSMEENVNVSWTNVIREDGKYILIFRLLGNEKYKLSNDIKLSVILEGVSGKVSYEGEVSSAMANYYIDGVDDYLDYMFVTISTDHYINRENKLRVYGANNSSFEDYIDIRSEMEVIISMQSPSTIATNGTNNEFLTIEDKALILSAGNLNIVGLTREKMYLVTAKELEYLWRYVTPTYNREKYLRYGSSVPLTYTENVYDVFPNGKTYEVVDGNVVYNKVHSKGDLVYDEEGNIIYKHKEGDTILDENGSPIIDGLNGVTRVLDIIMLEYNYKVFAKPKYLSYIKRHIADIVDLVTNTLRIENKTLLEHTRAIYRPLRSNAQINEDTKNVLSPLVELYFKEGTTISLDVTIIYNIIGELLNRYLSKRYIVMDDLEKEIEKAVSSNILSAKVSRCVEGNPKIIYLDDTGRFKNRYRIAKKIDRSLDIVYSFDLKIVEI